MGKGLIKEVQSPLSDLNSKDHFSKIGDSAAKYDHIEWLAWIHYFMRVKVSDSGLILCKAIPKL